MNASSDLNIFWFFGVIYRRRRLIASLLLLGLVVAVIVMVILPSKYRATTTLLIQPTERNSTSEINVLLAGERLALTYSEIIKSQPILESVISQHKLDIPVSKFAEKVLVQPVRDTQLVRLSVTDPSPEQATNLANSVAAAFVSYIEKLTTEQYAQGLEAAQGLKDVQADIDEKNQDVNLIQSNIDSKNALKTNIETELTRLNSLLSENRENYRAKQENYEDLQRTVAQLSDKVHIVEPAQVSGGVSPYTAKLTMLFDREAITDSVFIGPEDGPLLVGETLLEDVIKTLGLNETAESLQNRTWINPVTGTQILELNVKDARVDQAVIIATAIGDVFIKRTLGMTTEPYSNQLADIEKEMNTLNLDMQKLEEEIKENSLKKNQVDLELKTLETDLAAKNLALCDLQDNPAPLNVDAPKSGSPVVIAEPASVPDRPLQDRFLYVFLALLVTFFISLGTAFFLEYLEDKVVSQEDVTALLDVEPSGVIGHINQDDDELLFGAHASPLIAEDFRKLSAAILPALKGLAVQRILVTSPNPGEGKSVVTANLGIVLSKAGKEVVLVDADLRLPRLHELFRISQTNGLSDALRIYFTERLLQPTKNKGLRVLPCGDIPEDPIEVLNSARLKGVLDEISRIADLVLIDCPPILTLADASYLSPLVDGALLVIRSGHTERKAARKAMAILQKAGLRYVGVVLNDVYGHQSEYYRSYGVSSTRQAPVRGTKADQRLPGAFNFMKTMFKRTPGR